MSLSRMRYTRTNFCAVSFIKGLFCCWGSVDEAPVRRRRRKSSKSRCTVAATGGRTGERHFVSRLLATLAELMNEERRVKNNKKINKYSDSRWHYVCHNGAKNRHQPVRRFRNTFWSLAKFGQSKAKRSLDLKNFLVPFPVHSSHAAPLSWLAGP